MYNFFSKNNTIKKQLNIPMKSMSTIIKLYHCIDARSLRVLWTLEEMKIKNYELFTLPFPPRVLHKEFMKLNQLGTVPFLTIDDNVKMTESCAICHYLSQTYSPNLSISSNETDYSTFLNWLYHADSTLTFPQAVVLRYTKLQPGRADNAVSDYTQFHIGRLRMLDETLLNGNEFLVGNRVTVADICIAFSLYLGTKLEVNGKLMSDAYKPQTKDYLNRMINRDSFKRALIIQENSYADYCRNNNLQ
jgi:glutathione S-transferase